MPDITLGELAGILSLPKFDLSGALRIGLQLKQSPGLHTPLKPAEILMALCYDFCREQLYLHSVSEVNWLSILMELKGLCEEFGPLLEEHCKNYTPGVTKGVPAAALAIINGRYVTFTGSERMHDIWLGEVVEKSETPPKTICQLVLPAAYMEVYVQHEAKHSNQNSVV